MKKRQDNRYFEDVLNAIKNSEIDVDRFLEAARLERKERESRKLSSEQKANMIYIAMAILAVAAVFGFLLLLVVLLK